MEGAYDVSCPDPDCPKQGILNQHQMERLTSKDLMDKHRTFRLNTGNKDILLLSNLAKESTLNSNQY